MTQKFPIGIYNCSQIVTYLGVIVVVAGLSLAVSGRVRSAVICLVLAGAFDVADGFVARRFRRNRHEELAGIQLDSLADIVAFCVLPIIIFSSSGYHLWYQLVAYCLLATTGISRLTLFNVSQTINESRPVSYFRGLPVTFSALIFPLGYVAMSHMTNHLSGPFIALLFCLVSVMFVSDFKMKKPAGAWYGVIAITVVLLIILVVLS
jgi:CDP-diacylglycerol--serine O-phosphatidyltransferase